MFSILFYDYTRKNNHILEEKGPICYVGCFNIQTTHDLLLSSYPNQNYKQLQELIKAE